MEMKAFMDTLLDAAKNGGIGAAEIYYSDDDSFSAKAREGEIDSYEVSATRRLSLRGSVDGKMGYASTEAFDAEAVAYLVEAVKESAALNEAEDQDEIFAGDESYPEIEEESDDLDEVTAAEKLSIALQADEAARTADTRIPQTEGATVSTHRGQTILRNSYGLNLRRTRKLFAAYVIPIARDGDSTATGFKLEYGRKLRGLDPVKLGKDAAADAVSMLHAEPVASGEYRIIFRHDAMQSLLQTFCGIFSAESAQQKTSLLAGREGEEIASPLITITDDPLRRGGLATAAFDGEGSATHTKAVVEKGVLKTLLHNRRTAKKQGVRTTGNASRADGIHVSPSNFFIEPGEKSLDELLQNAGSGLLITDLSGLHAGANPISGDFSLLSKGFVIRDGAQAEPVERITVAGNFYQLLKSVRAVGNDLEFPGSPVGSPSVDAGMMPVSGK